MTVVQSKTVSIPLKICFIEICLSFGYITFSMWLCYLAGLVLYDGCGVHGFVP